MSIPRLSTDINTIWTDEIDRQIFIETTDDDDRHTRRCVVTRLHSDTRGLNHADESK